MDDLRFVIAADDWDEEEHLQRAIRSAPRVIVVVADEAMRERGERAAARIGRTDLAFEVATPAVERASGG